MNNVFKLPNGGCMYSHEEIKIACKVYRVILSDRNKAEEAATDYANIMWKQLPFYKRFWYQTKSGIFDPDEWWDLYSKAYCEGMERWDGKGKVVSTYQNYSQQGMDAEDLCRMEESERNCYLNPKQIEVLEELTSLKERL